jgi:hypothetical protein
MLLLNIRKHLSQSHHSCPWVKPVLAEVIPKFTIPKSTIPKPTISKLPELVIFGGPLPKSRFSAISATVFHANLITGNIRPRVDEPLCHWHQQVNPAYPPSLP